MKPKKGLLLLASDDSKDSHDDMPDLGEYGDDEDKKDGGKDEAEEGDDEQLALDCMKDLRKALLDRDDRAALEHLKELLGYIDKD